MCTCRFECLQAAEESKRSRQTFIDQRRKCSSCMHVSQECQSSEVYLFEKNSRVHSTCGTVSGCVICQCTPLQLRLLGPGFLFPFLLQTFVRHCHCMSHTSIFCCRCLFSFDEVKCETSHSPRLLFGDWSMANNHCKEEFDDFPSQNVRRERGLMHVRDLQRAQSLLFVHGIAGRCDALNMVSEHGPSGRALSNLKWKPTPYETPTRRHR